MGSTSKGATGSPDWYLSGLDMKATSLQPYQLMPAAGGLPELLASFQYLQLILSL